MKKRDVRDMPVMANMCKTCPFGPNGNKQVMAQVISRILDASQTCHTTGMIHNRPDTHLCRGARNWQQQVLHGMGIIDAPTDEAWQKKRQEWNI